MMRTLFMAAIAVAIASTAVYGGQNFLLFGVGSSSGAAIAACGSGVIDLSAGCMLPVQLGLVP